MVWKDAILLSKNLQPHWPLTDTQITQYNTVHLWNTVFKGLLNPTPPPPPPPLQAPQEHSTLSTFHRRGDSLCPSGVPSVCRPALGPGETDVGSQADAAFRELPIGWRRHAWFIKLLQINGWFWGAVSVVKRKNKDLWWGPDLVRKLCEVILEEITFGVRSKEIPVRNRIRFLGKM